MRGEKFYSSVMNFHRKIFFFPLFLFVFALLLFQAAFFFFFSCDSPFRSTFDYVNLLVTVRFHNSFPRCLTLLCNYRYLVYQFPLVLCRKNYSISFFVSDWIKFWVNNRILKNCWIFFSYFLRTSLICFIQLFFLWNFFGKLFIFANIDVFFINDY